ncbi:hypothetical protein [Sinomicrobium sp. M5D2P17]
MHLKLLICGILFLTNGYTENIKNEFPQINCFEERPYYSIEFSNTGSTINFEILVNDVPVVKFLNEEGGISSAVPINTAILESGQQSIKVNAYPPMGKQLIKQEQKDILSVKVSYLPDAWSTSSQNEVVIFELPQINIPGDGVPYWKYEGEFEAEVPYHLSGWLKSRNLKEVDDLEEKVFRKFRELQKILANKDTKLLLELSGKKNTEIYTSLFLKKEDIKGREDFMEIEEDEEVIPLDDTVILKFYGNNRLVTLEYPDGESALRTKIREEGFEDEIITYDILLHIPIGTEDLEIIR